MVRRWFKADPSFFERVKQETLAAFPDLKFELRDGRVFLIGPFRLVHEGEEIDCYEIAVELPDDFPRGAPEIYETAGRIRRVADEHAYVSGRICLFVPGERWRFWPEGGTLVDFLQGPVRSHLIAHAHYELTGEWPFGERSHGPDGIFEAYSEMLGITDKTAIVRFLDVLAHRALKGHWSCPCGSGRRLRACHGQELAELRKKITVAEATLARRHATGAPAGGSSPQAHSTKITKGLERGPSRL